MRLIVQNVVTTSEFRSLHSLSKAGQVIVDDQVNCGYIQTSTGDVAIREERVRGMSRSIQRNQ